jgi:hypothetical protein
MIATGTEPAVLPIEGQVFRRGDEDALRQIGWLMLVPSQERQLRP